MQESPAKSGIELANWNWKVVRQFVLESLGIRPEPQQLPELSAPAGIRAQAPQETSGQG